MPCLAGLEKAWTKMCSPAHTQPWTAVICLSPSAPRQLCTLQLALQPRYPHPSPLPVFNPTSHPTCPTAVAPAALCFLPQLDTLGHLSAGLLPRYSIFSAWLMVLCQCANLHTWAGWMNLAADSSSQVVTSYTTLAGLSCLSGCSQLQLSSHAFPHVYALQAATAWRLNFRPE